MWADTVGTDFLERGGIWGKLQRMGCTVEAEKSQEDSRWVVCLGRHRAKGMSTASPVVSEGVFLLREGFHFGDLWFLNYCNAMLITTNCRWMKIKVMITVIVGMHCLLIETLSTWTISCNLHNNSKRVLLHIFCS